MFENLNEITPYLSTTIPTAISIAIGTIQCVESAKRAGDFYPTREAMFADGIGTLIASLFGSILGMTSKSVGRSAPASYQCVRTSFALWIFLLL